MLNNILLKIYITQKEQVILDKQVIQCGSFHLKYRRDLRSLAELQDI